MSDEQKETKVDGIRAIELRYRAVKETTGDDTVFYQSQMRFNAPSMGVLSPARYSSVYENSTQSITIFELAFRQFLVALNKFSERGIQYDWISIYMPLRYLKTDNCVQKLLDYCKNAIIRPERVCFEISPGLLDETDGTVAGNIKLLREQDFRFMITGVGGKYSILNLGKFNIDYIMLHPDAVTISPENEREWICLQRLVSLINELDSDVIACDVADGSQVKALASIECTYYTGDYSSTFMEERYMRSRNKNEEDDTG